MVKIATSSEAFSEEEIPTPLAVLSIDADGALDRDFSLFYNELLPEATVILDDYEDKINSHGERQLDMSEAQLQACIEERGLRKLCDANSLGKEYTTFRFVNYLLKAGLLEKQAVHGSTFFGRKPKNAPTFTKQHYNEMQQSENK